MSRHRRALALGLVAALLAAAGCADATTPNPSPTAGTGPFPTGEVAHGDLVFRDEFDGTTLGRAWTPLRGTPDNRFGRPFNPTKEDQSFAASQVSVADGHLRLQAESRSSTVDDVTYPYTSGMVQSRGNVEFQYGYVEFRMNVPGDRGYWPSAWLVGAVHEMAEIDIAEFLGDRNGRYGPMMNVHWGKDWDSMSQWGLKSVGDPKGAYGGSWHTYGLRWDPEAVQTYVDGVPGPRYEGPGVPTQPMYLIFNLSVHKTKTPAPATMLVDYVRVWK